jgi:hypothetical protein
MRLSLNNLLRNTVYNNTVHQLLVTAYRLGPAIIGGAFGKAAKSIRGSSRSYAHPTGICQQRISGVLEQVARCPGYTFKLQYQFTAVTTIQNHYSCRRFQAYRLRNFIKVETALYQHPFISLPRQVYIICQLAQQNQQRLFLSTTCALLLSAASCNNST